MKPTLHRYILDTRPLQAQANPTHTPYLDLLPPNLHAPILAFHRPADRLLSLGSALLKHLAITRHCNIPWSAVGDTLSCDAVTKKPCFRPPKASVLAGGSEQHDEAGKIQSSRLNFNVSHQAGIVVLVASTDDRRTSSSPPSLSSSSISPQAQQSPLPNVGVDVVCTSERQSTQSFDKWVDMFEEVFSEDELALLKSPVDPSSLSRPVDDNAHPDPTSVPTSHDDHHHHYHYHDDNNYIDYDSEYNKNRDEDKTKDEDAARRRRFYAHWAIHEAFIKLKGEALLAPWLRDLQVDKVRVPEPVAPGRWGDPVRDVRVRMGTHGIKDVSVELQAFGPDYIVATAVDITGLASDLNDHHGLHNDADANHDYDNIVDDEIRRMAFPAWQVVDIARDFVGVRP
ncbi:MAG: hypothetical protein M1825_004319 [Sarcosagium campestre]|nr:MAG: hypothetical protein M1825_004319 [Sarcosagium campestre]